MAKHSEPHTDASLSGTNSLRAAVLGANDGIMSVAAIVVGVAGATAETHSIFIAGLAGLLAGALRAARLKRQVTRLRREQRSSESSPVTGSAPGTSPASGPGFGRSDF